MLLEVDTAAVAVTVGRLPFAAKLLLNCETADGGRTLLDVDTADAEIAGRFTAAVAGTEGAGTLFIMPGIGISAGHGSS